MEMLLQPYGYYSIYWDGAMIMGVKVGKDLEGSDRGFCKETIPEFAWRG
jgi:hypothetical protein